MRLLLLVPALALAAAGQTDSPITREGKAWVQVSHGTAAVGTELRITTRGAISVQGEARTNVAYTVKRLARTRDLAEARALLSRVALKTTRQGGWTVLEIELPRDYAVSADLQLRVPRTLRETALRSQAGAIEGFDLYGSVRAEARGGPVHLDRIEGNAEIETGGGEVRLGRIGRTLNCSSSGGNITADSIGGAAALNTGGGSIFVREVKDLLRATTGGGNIRVLRADSGVVASSGGGLIDVLEANGPVMAQTGNGAIKVRSAPDVRCQSGAGAIQLQAVYGGLRASTGMGSIMAVLMAGKPLQDSTLTTAMGDITVYFPSNLAVTVKAINDSPGGQRIVSEFTEIRTRLDQGNWRSQAEGSLNGGGPILRLENSGGIIYLRRQK